MSGRKHDFIVKLGNAFSNGGDGVVLYHNERIYTKEHLAAAIIRYAPYNFFRDFSHSALGVFMKEHLAANGLFIDAGANLGGYSRCAKELGCFVHLVEPEPTLAAFLHENESFFGKHYGVALSDEKGTANFFVSDKNIGGSSLVTSTKGWEGSGYTKSVKVEVATFDALFQAIIAKHEGKTLVKIDVEGNEEKTVAGMSNTLSNGKINYVWCEVRGPQSDRNANSYIGVTRQLAHFGYVPFVYSAWGEMIPFQEQIHVRQYFDLLFLKK